MRKVLFLLVTVCTMVHGCGALVSDVQGWDLSPCVADSDSFWTCYDLFEANQEQILGGQSVIDLMMGAISSQVPADTANTADTEAVDAATANPVRSQD